MRYASDRSDEELGYGVVWPQPGIAAVDPFDTTTWVASHITMRAGEICNDILMMIKISRNHTGSKRLSFGLNNGMLRNFHGSMMSDNGTMVTVEQSAVLIEVCRKWFAVQSIMHPIKAKSGFRRQISIRSCSDVLYDQIFIREREENDGNLVYYPNRAFSEEKNVRKLYQLMAAEGYVIVYLQHRDKSVVDNARFHYFIFRSFLFLISPFRSSPPTNLSSLFCQKTSNSTRFEGMHRGALS
ncbi:hypothetical protein PENTCL1PPCAC_25978, partial [Pristionchus entomophagus]